MSDTEVLYGRYNVNTGMTIMHTWTPPKNWKPETVRRKVHEHKPCGLASHFSINGGLWGRLK